GGRRSEAGDDLGHGRPEDLRNCGLCVAYAGLSARVGACVQGGKGISGKPLAWRDRPARESWPPDVRGTGWILAAFSSLASALAEAAYRRRLFVLLPFHLIFGLALYAALPAEPTGPVLAGGAILAAALIVLAGRRRSLRGLRLGVHLGAFWFGFCLLPLHAAFFGTTVLAYPTLGTYGARVDEVISADDRQRRVLVSLLQPVDG